MVPPPGKCQLRRQAGAVLYVSPDMGCMPSGFSGPTLGKMPADGSVKELQLPTFGKDGGPQVQKNPRDPPGGRAVPLPQKEKVNVGEGAPNQYILGEGLPPIPAKLVAKIQRGDYVDMAELLRDNMEMGRQQAATSTPSDTQKSSRREVPDILSRITCFGMYASVVAEKYPDRVRQLFSYQMM